MIISKISNTENIINSDLRHNMRIQGFDMARAFAIICVVLCHSIEFAYSNVNYLNLSESSQIFRILFFTISRLGVPIFLFLTGALILKKQIESDDDILKFYKKNLLPLFITIEIWNVIYNIFLGIIYGNFSIETLIYNILFFKQVDFTHMWYMPMILGMYIAVPFLAKIVKVFTLKSILIPLIINFLITMVLPSINIILSIFGLEQYSIILDISFLGGWYGVYIILGYYIANKNILKKINQVWIVCVMLVSFALTFAIQYISYKNNVPYDVWYNVITLFICSMCIFEMFTRVISKQKSNCFINVSKYISQISLAIFFMHELFLKLFVDKISFNKLINPVETFILFITSMGLSVISIYVLSKIKFLRKYLYIIKN